MVPELRHQMYLKVMPFNFALMALGCLEDADAARLLGMKSPKTIERAREGGALSSEFIATAMAAFRLNAERLQVVGIDIKLDTFFEEATRQERGAAELAEVA